MRAFPILAALVLAAGSFGADWSRFVSGPFEVLSKAGQKPARRILTELEQVRHALGTALEKQDLEAVWPMRVVVFASERNCRGCTLGEWFERRDRWVLGVVRGRPLPHAQLARILIAANTRRMPEEVERGLTALFSTIEVEGVRVRLGKPVPRPDIDWARMHMLLVDPEYSVRTPVLLANLQQGADWHVAYKNAFGKAPDEMEAMVKEYLARGDFPVREFSGAPVSPKRFHPRDYRPEYVETAVADLLEGEAARAAYQAVLAKYGDYPPALEGLGRFEAAVKAGSRSARCLFEYAKLLKEPARARQALVRATELNPRWAEPWALMADLETNAALKIRDLKKATELDSRNLAYWEALSQAYLDAGDLRQASIALGGAMRAARTPEEREAYYQKRLRLEERRAEQRVQSRQSDLIRRRRTEARRLREEWEEMLRRAREAEEAAGGEGAADVVEWWDDPRPKAKIWGVLKEVECTRGPARLVIEDSDGELTRLVVKDPGKVVILGREPNATLGCGKQNPPRPVAVEYYKPSSPGGKSAGEVAVVEFR